MVVQSHPHRQQPHIFNHRYHHRSVRSCNRTPSEGGGVQIAELLHKIVSERCEPIVGVVDRLTADFALVPLPIGTSCRDGVVACGRVLDVGETVRFQIEHCMMQKVHSGVVVHSEGDRVRIERIDLKVW